MNIEQLLFGIMSGIAIGLVSLSLFEEQIFSFMDKVHDFVHGKLRRHY